MFIIRIIFSIFNYIKNCFQYCFVFKLIINNELKPIYRLINNRTIYWEKYDTNSILYNPIVEDRENIRVNNMLVDSAPHNQLLARIYDGSSWQEQIKKIKDFLNKYHSKLKNKPNKLLIYYRI